MTAPLLPPTNNDREVALRELIASFEQRSSSTTVDLFETAKKDLSGTKKLLYGGGTAFAALLTTVAGWSMDFIQQEKKQGDMIEAQSQKIDDLEVRLRLITARQKAIGNRMVGNEILIVDGLQWVADKIDAGKKSSKEDRPRSITAARRRIDDAGTMSGDLFRFDALEQ